MLVESPTLSGFALQQLLLHLFHLFFLLLDEHTLHALILGIFAHVLVATEHLGEIIGRENKEQFVLRLMILVEINHRTLVVLLLLGQLAFQLLEFGVEAVDATLQRVDLCLGIADGLLLLVDLCIKNSQVGQFLFDGATGGAQLLLVFLHLLLQLFALVAQLAYLGVGLSRKRHGGDEQ